jgi:hypothetical protein
MLLLLAHIADKIHEKIVIYRVALFSKMDSLSYVYISLPIHGL